MIRSTGRSSPGAKMLASAVGARTIATIHLFLELKGTVCTALKPSVRLTPSRALLVRPEIKYKKMSQY